MKNINEQIDRIKQLFTEERLHGNLVEQSKKKKRTKYIDTKDKSRSKYEKAIAKSKSPEEVQKAMSKYDDTIKKAEQKYLSNKNAFKGLLWKEGGMKIYSHKDTDWVGNKIKLVQLPKGSFADERIISQAKKMIQNYYSTKLKEVVYPMDIDSFEKGKHTYLTFLVFSTEPSTNVKQDDTQEKGEEREDGKMEKMPMKTIDKIDPISDKGTSSAKSTEKSSSDTQSSKPEEKPSNMTKMQSKTATSVGSASSAELAMSQKGSTQQVQPKETKQTGDITAFLNKSGVGQKGMKYVTDIEKNDPEHAGEVVIKKLDANGKLQATYVQESKINLKTLFESAYRFNEKESIIEAWKWKEGNKPVGAKISDVFDKALDNVDTTGGETKQDQTGGETKQNQTGNDNKSNKPSIDQILNDPEYAGSKEKGISAKPTDKELGDAKKAAAEKESKPETKDKGEDEWWKNQPIEKDIELLKLTWNSLNVNYDEMKRAANVMNKYKNNICQFADKHLELTNQSLKAGIDSVTFISGAGRKLKDQMLNMIQNCKEGEPTKDKTKDNSKGFENPGANMTGPKW